MKNLKQSMKRMTSNKLETLVKFLRFYKEVADYPLNLLVKGIKKLKGLWRNFIYKYHDWKLKRTLKSIDSILNRDREIK